MKIWQDTHQKKFLGNSDRNPRTVLGIRGVWLDSDRNRWGTVKTSFCSWCSSCWSYVSLFNGTCFSTGWSHTSARINIINLPRPISLTEFCMHYEISDSDRQKLEVLEVHLGDCAVEMLESEYWKEAGFTKLGWGCFLRAHKQFLKDVSNGIWIWRLLHASNWTFSLTWLLYDIPCMFEPLIHFFCCYATTCFNYCWNCIVFITYNPPVPSNICFYCCKSVLQSFYKEI